MSAMNTRRILLVDDDDDFRRKIREAIGGIYRLTEASSEDEFRRLYRPQTFALVILDMRLKSEKEGMELLREIFLYDELQPVIMVSAYGDTETTVDAIESGALMFLDKKEFSPNLIARMVQAVLQQGQLKRQLDVLQNRLQMESPIDFVGTNSEIIKASQQARQAANDAESSILIVAERGSGRELLARMVHGYSLKRKAAPFKKINAANVHLDSVNGLLFRSASQIGIQRQKGLLEVVNGGVLFLDEIWNFPKNFLERIKKSLDEGAFFLKGDSIPVSLDIQIVSAIEPSPDNRQSTNPLSMFKFGDKPLIEIYIPPLRERKEDIALLSAYFLQNLRRQGKTTARIVSKAVLDLFENYSWPGNVSELRNTIECAGIRATLNRNEEILTSHLPFDVLQVKSPQNLENISWDYRFHVARTEIWLVGQMMEERGITQKSKLANALGYNDRFTFSRRIKQNLQTYNSLAREFPSVAGLFNGRRTH